MLGIVSFVFQNWKLFAVAAALAGAFAWFEVQQHNAFTQGQQAATQRVEQANDASQKRAVQGQTDVDGCYRAGGAWDRDHGLCVSSGSGR